MRVATRICLRPNLSIVRCCSSTASSSTEIVETTGYVYLDAERKARHRNKYGVYFGENDSRNTFGEIHQTYKYPTITHVTMKIYALIQAIKLSDPKKDLIIKTDYNLDEWSRLEKWASRDFKMYTNPSCKMKNAIVLEELHKLKSEREHPIKLQYTEFQKEYKTLQWKNPVMERLIDEKRKRDASLPPINADIEPSDSLDENGTVHKFSTTTEWPVVYAAGVLDSWDRGSYGILWTDDDSLSSSQVQGQRLVMLPCTEFRADLAAIKLALEQAQTKKLSNVLVVTKSPHFLTHWKNEWKKRDGTYVANKPLFDRIKSLVDGRNWTVHFRYEEPIKSEDSSSTKYKSPIWATLLAKCEEFTMYPKILRDRSEYGKTIEDITAEKCEEAENGKEVCRVRYFKKGTGLRSGLLWDKVNATDPKFFKPLLKSDHLDIITEILTKAQQDYNDIIIIRTDSDKLIRAIESWLPVWQRNNWRNARGIPLTNREGWSKVKEMLDNVKVYWELMDPLTDEDIEVVKQFAKKKLRHLKKSEEQQSITSV